MKSFYSIGLRIFQFLIWLGSKRNAKWKELYIGQKYTFKVLASIPKPLGSRYWVHCASLGEYEMALPLIEGLLEKDHQSQVLVSFFSPSGFKHAKLPERVFKTYLPLDRYKLVKRWYKKINAKAAIFVKYEFWPNFLREAHRLEIPVYFWNAVFREDHFINAWWASFWMQGLIPCKQFFTQNLESTRLATNWGLKATTLGDSRYLRMKQLRDRQPEIPHSLVQWATNKSILIAGSSWPEEEAAISSFFQKVELADNQRIIIVPHDISTEHVVSIIERFPSGAIEPYSIWDGQTDPSILIIDKIGLLSRLYALANLAIIGGGFGRGLHNTIEPIAAGLPVLFGNIHEKFPEAQEMILHDIAADAVNPSELAVLIDSWWNSPELGQQKRTQVLDFFNDRVPRIETALDSIIGLTN